jgi:hypothetical protein
MNSGLWCHAYQPIVSELLQIIKIDKAVIRQIHSASAEVKVGI